jgi:hypothetical protein
MRLAEVPPRVGVALGAEIELPDLIPSEGVSAALEDDGGWSKAFDDSVNNGDKDVVNEHIVINTVIERHVDRIALR